MNKLILACLTAIVPIFAYASSQNAEETLLCRGVDDTTIELLPICWTGAGVV